MTNSKGADVSIRDFGAVGDGRTDDYVAIQAALDSGARHVLIPAGTHIIRNVLKPHEGQCLEIHGTVKVADAVIQPLAKDVAIGDSEVTVADGSRFFPGQWVTLHDEQLPIQGGGRKVRRQNAGNARIVAIAGNTLTLDARSARAYRREAKAILATQHSVILIEKSGVRICGTGTVDGNKKNQFDAAPGRLEDVVGEDWRAASGIVVFGYPDRLDQIIIEGVTVQDTVLHGIAMRDVTRSIVRHTICRRAHDKNISLRRLTDCRIEHNIACDSEWEDGIIFHQVSDPDLASWRVAVHGNICSGNPRNGLAIGAHMHQIFLSDNLCVNNCINISINADDCSSSGDVAIGYNDRLHPLTQQRASVSIAGRTVRVDNLTSLGTPSVALCIHGTDVTVTGGVLGDMTPRGAGYDGVGLDLCPGNRASNHPNMVPDRVVISGVRLRGCVQAVRAEASTGQVTLANCCLEGNGRLGDVPPEVWGRFRLEGNAGLVSRSRGVARVAPAGTRVTVAHGLCRAPGMAGITVTPVGSPGEACRFWVEKADAAGFDIVVDRAPGRAGAEFAWQAEV